MFPGGAPQGAKKLSILDLEALKKVTIESDDFNPRLFEHLMH